MGIYTPTSVSRETRNSIGYETYCKSRGIHVVKAKITTNTSKTKEQQRVRVFTVGDAFCGGSPARFSAAEAGIDCL